MVPRSRAFNKSNVNFYQTAYQSARVMMVDSTGRVSAQCMLSCGVLFTIVDVIKISMGVVQVIDNQGTAQAITVLVLEMTVVPVCSL